jgi:plasmid stabilization system protein ParE
VVLEPFPLTVRRLARLDIEEAATWYEDRVGGLGTRFLEEVDHCLESIRSAPSRYPVVYRDVRRALLKRFPYAVFFLFRDETITVIACVHTRRHARRWQRRR